jgi:uncharacterized protein YycO
MKRFSRSEFEEKVIGYYGRRKKKPVSGQKAIIMSRYFDNGAGVSNNGNSGKRNEYNLAASVTNPGEYDLASKGNGFTNYEVISSSLTAQQSYDETFFVEPFEDTAVVQKEECTCAGKEKNPGTDAALQAKKLQQEALESISTPEIPSISLGKKSDYANEKDFLEDMKSILSGSKQFDPESKRIVDKGKMKEPVARQQSAADTQEPVRPIETKSEHDIFNKIAESMRYANAYDLGSFAIEQRFDEFDKFDEIKKNAKGRKAAAAPVETYSRQAKPEIPVSHEEFLKDMDMIAEQKSKTTEEKAPAKTPSPQIPLDPGVGGQSIMISAMRPGDIIISTTDSDISKRIRQATGSVVSHAAVYVGDGYVIEAVDEGVLQLTVEASISQDSVAVAYRHKDMTSEKAAKVVAFLKDAKAQRRKFDFMGLIRVAPFQIVSGYCDSLPEAMRATCKAGASKFKLGTDNNDEFYCSELVFEAFMSAGLNISDIDPHWSSAQDVVRLNHNGTLKYVGHLKAF